jgi:hypothetical protein
MEHPFFAWLVGERTAAATAKMQQLRRRIWERLALGVEGGGFGFEDGGGLRK